MRKDSLADVQQSLVQIFQGNPQQMRHTNVKPKKNHIIMTVGTSSVPTICICCVAAMLTKSSTATTATMSRAMAAQQSFLSIYTPSTNVDSIASLDIDQRSIVARLAKGNSKGFAEARQFYVNGGTYAGQTRTIQSLSTGAQQEFLGGAYSTTFLDYTDYYGDTDYADAWISAAFEGGETEFRASTSHGSVDFGNFDFEGRAGELENIFVHIFYVTHII